MELENNFPSLTQTSLQKDESENCGEKLKREKTVLIAPILISFFFLTRSILIVWDVDDDVDEKTIESFNNQNACR